MSSTVTDKGLFEYALMQPRFSANAPDTLRIVSGYATHAMAARHLIEMTAKKQKLSIDLIYGMAGSDGVGSASACSRLCAIWYLFCGHMSPLMFI